MEKGRFHSIGALLVDLYEENNWVEAQELALEYLELADQNMSNWNYGNAIHHANLILGKIRLENDDINGAKEYLLKAGMTPGSPQLNSFGPNMTLVSDLLELGEKEIVIQYLNLVKKFWNPLFSFFKIRKWKKAIQKGGIPNFGGNAIYYVRRIPIK